MMQKKDPELEDNFTPEKMKKEILEWIILEAKPFTFSESPFLYSYTRLLRPQATKHLFGATTTRSEIDKLFEEFKEKMVKIFKVRIFYFILFFKETRFH
jgi:hypothetical protein